MYKLELIYNNGKIRNLQATNKVKDDYISGALNSLYIPKEIYVTKYPLKNNERVKVK